MGAVPWHLVIYTAPGVIIGGQIGSRLQGNNGSQMRLPDQLACRRYVSISSFCIKKMDLIVR